MPELETRCRAARRPFRERIGRNPSVAEIAHTHGFASEAHFSRLFKLVYGGSPGAVRLHPTRPAPQYGDDIHYCFLVG